MSPNYDSKFWLYGMPSQAGLDTETSQSADSHLAPMAIREAYQEIFSGYNIAKYYEDKGDAPVSATSSVPEVLEAAQEIIANTLKSGFRPAILGGSHTFTYGSLKALKQEVGDFSLLYFDAHPDLMPDEKIYYGSTLYHAINDGILDPKRIAFIGIRQIEKEEADLIEQHQPLVLSPLEINRDGISACLERIEKQVPGPYYMSIDLDGLDSAIAPGVTTPFPFGLSRLDLLGLALPFCKKDLLGFEIVEYSKSRDIQGLTAHLAAALLQELSSTACTK